MPETVWLVQRYVAYEGHDDIRAFATNVEAQACADALRAYADAAPEIGGDNLTDEEWNRRFDANRAYFAACPWWLKAPAFTSDEIQIDSVPFGAISRTSTDA